MSDRGTYDEILAEEIQSCTEVHMAFNDTLHPCNKIVNWQKSVIPDLKNLQSLHLSAAHRPEAWAGNLNDAKILFLGSNPSFSEDEIFPDYKEEWANEKLRDFGARRFEGTEERPFGANEQVDLKLRDRIYLKNGKLNEKTKVTHWNEIRGNVAAILGRDKEDVTPNKDYVMTELVHCKSRDEVGVPEALSFCTQKFFQSIMSASSAKLVFVLGVKPASHFRTLFREVPNSWGVGTDSLGTHGVWPRSNKELQEMRATGLWSASHQLKHTFQMSLGGTERTVVWFPRPGRPAWPRSLNGENCPIDLEVLEFWRSKLD
jgi:hypothetical protein